MTKFLTGIKPSGELHIGNYFGSIKTIIDLQERIDLDIYIFVADLHTLTNKHIRDNPQVLNTNVHSMLIAYLSLGIDPKRVKIYKQSDFPQITFLQWIFTCLLTVPYLQRAHAYKDIIEKGNVVNVGVMQYPVLMAADILLPNASVVPVGPDQLQHLEITRYIARTFNSTYGDIFDEPKALQTDTVSVSGINGKKMSKSENNTIPIFADKDTLYKLIAKIKTSSINKGQPIDTKSCPIFQYHKLFSEKNELKSLKTKYENGSIGYKESKDLLTEKIYTYFSDAHKKYQGYVLETDLQKDIFNIHKEYLTHKFNTRLELIKEHIGINEKRNILHSTDVML